MLQRAASNACSWWWASHIRTKQSKWLDNNLQEMEEKVKKTIKLIGADGDSFAKKAEMYFRTRPELIDFVEDAFRSYKALADRYDRISAELHKANHTIAAAFPDQVQFSLDDDDDDGIPRAITDIDTSQFRKPPSGLQISATRGKSKEEAFTLRRTNPRKIASHLSKEKAQEEIDSLQKKILGLQTEKEFVKSSYQSGQAKFSEIERQIAEMQEEICSLQEDFSVEAVIEDDVARALMAATAIKSCEDSLVSLHEQQKISDEEARVESQRIRDAEEKLIEFKIGCGQSPVQKNSAAGSSMSADEDDSGLKGERLELQSVCQKVKEHFERSSEASVVELAEKIDGLVDKVINLELTVASQTAQIKRLITDTDELQKDLNCLEEDKPTLIVDSNSLARRLKQADDELQKVQELEKCVQNDKSSLRLSIKEAFQNFNDLSETLQSPENQEQEAETPISETKGEDFQVHKTTGQPSDSKEDAKKDGDGGGGDDGDDGRLQEQIEEPDLQNLLLSADGLEGKEKILFEYNTMLGNYRDTKKRLSEIEKKNQECHSETMEQVKELKIANAMKDEEIRILRQILSSLQANLHSNAGKNSSQKSEDKNAKDDVKLSYEYKPEASSSTEEKIRADIDTLLEENLDFWLRFSTSYHQIQKFQTTFTGLQSEIAELQKIKSLEPSSSDPVASTETLKNESAPIEKKLRELNRELQIWLENNALLNGELQSRSSSLCSIQEEISRISRASEESEHTQFSHYQAAKFQGEVRNMQLENNKVAKELQTGMDHARGLQVEIAKALSRLRESLIPQSRSHQSSNNNPVRHLSTKARIPLRTFLFGSKAKKQSLFACVNPAVHKQIRDSRPGLPT